MVFLPAVHLMSFVHDSFPCGGSQRSCLLWVGSCAIFVPEFILLMLPLVAAVWIVWLGFIQKSLGHSSGSASSFFLADLSIWGFLWLGVYLCSARLACLTSVAGVVSADLASGQSCDLMPSSHGWPGQICGWCLT